MGVRLCKSEFNEFLLQLSHHFRLYAPIKQDGKGKFAETDVIGYGEIQNFEDIILDEKSYFSPKEILYPIRESLFYFNGNTIETPDQDEKPSVIFLRPCDLNGIGKLDTIFLKNGNEVDSYYERRRKKVKFFMLECTEGFNSCFCVSMKSNIAHNYDVAVQVELNEVTLKIVDEDLKSYLPSSVESIDYEPNFINENKVKVSIPPIESLTKESFNHEIWKTYAGRCIACGRCNTSCITCSCFTMQDVVLSDDKKRGERRRVWAGCHVDGFTDMAGGHGFRSNNGERMRFKTMHKVNDFHKRFDEHMCVGCGRCDDVCPEYISFSKCINKLDQIVKGGCFNE